MRLAYIEQKSRCGRLFCSMPGTEKAKWHGSCYIKIIDTEDKKKQLAAKRRELSKAKKRIAEIDTLIQKICDTRVAHRAPSLRRVPDGISLLCLPGAGERGILVSKEADLKRGGSRKGQAPRRGREYGGVFLYRAGSGVESAHVGAGDHHPAIPLRFGDHRDRGAEAEQPI